MGSNNEYFVCLKVVTRGKPEILFAKNIDVPDGKADTISAALKTYLEEANVPARKLAGFGSDGAAVMTGKKSGVGMCTVQSHRLLLENSISTFLRIIIFCLI